MYAPQNGIFGNFLQSWQFSLDPRIPTIGDLMREQGYTTAYYGKWHLSMAGLSATEGAGRERGRATTSGPTASTTPSSRPRWSPPATTTASTTTRSGPSRGSTGCTRTAARSSRGCCVVSLLNPHDIAYFPRGFSADVTRPDWQVELPLNFEDDPATKPAVHQPVRDGRGADPRRHRPRRHATWQRLMNTYCDLIVNTDDNLGAIVKALHDSGAMDDTVIIRTADHGEMGASHRAVGKGPMIYDEQLRMPLSISWPKRFARQGARTPALAEAVDILPTCLELAGVADPVARYPWLRGRSLVPAVERPATARGQGLHGQHLRRGLVAAGLRRPGQAVEAPRARRAVGALQGRALRRDGRQAAEGAHRRPGVRALRPAPRIPTSCATSPRDPAYKPLLDDMLARLRELEDERLAPVEVPAYGGAVADRAAAPRPARPARDAARRAARRPVAGRGHAGRLRAAAVRRPAPRAPRLRERRRRARCPRPPTPRARWPRRGRGQRAAMLCELGPAPRQATRR